MPYVVGLAADGLPPFKGFIAVTTHNCGISSKSRVYSPCNAPYTPPHKPPKYIPIMLLASLTSKPFFLQLVFPQYQSSSSSVYQWTTTSTIPYINPFNNPAILYSLHMAEPSENTFINIFVHSFPHSTQLPYPYIRDFIHSPDDPANLWGCSSIQPKF